MTADDAYTPDPRFGAPGPVVPDRHLVALMVELETARAENRRLKRVVVRANIAGGVLIALWLVGLFVNLPEHVSLLLTGRL